MSATACVVVNVETGVTGAKTYCQVLIDKKLIWFYEDELMSLEDYDKHKITFKPKAKKCHLNDLS